MSKVSRDEIKAYASHVRQEKFEPFNFPASWYELPVYSDVVEGIISLQRQGFICSTLSNGSKELLEHASKVVGINWDHIIDLASHKAYKPNIKAYYSIEKDLSIPVSETLLITANKVSGDMEQAHKVGMCYQLIRNGYPETILDLADLLINVEE